MTDVRGPDGKVVRFPDGTDQQTINRVMSSIYAKPKPQRKSVGRQLLDNTVNDLAGIAQGVFALPDMAATGVGKVLSAPLTAAAMIAERTGRSGRSLRATANALANPFTIGGLIEKVAPTPDSTSGRIQRFGGQLVGSLATGRLPSGNFSRFVNPEPTLNALGVLPPVPKGFRVSAKPGKAIPAAKQVVADAAKAKVRVMTSDVRPPRTFMGQNARSIGEKIPFAGTGGTRAAQQAERVEAVKTLLRDYGGDDAVKLFDDAPSAVDDVTKDLLARRGKELGRLSGLKTDVINKLSYMGVPVDRTITAIDEQIGRLAGTKLPEYKPVITKLEGWKHALQGQNLKNIEEVRKQMGSAFKGDDMVSIRDAGEKALRKIYGPIREDMGRFIKVFGGKGEYMKWKAANDRLAAMSGDLENGALKRVLSTGEMTPENVTSLLFSKKPSDVKRLVEGLSQAGQARARTAVLQRAFDKAISADGGLSVERFVNNLSSLGSPVGVTFKGADRARVEGLVRVLNATRRASAANVMPPTGVQNTPIVGGYALGALFGQAAIPVAGVGGLLARAYESAPVRNVLIALGKTKPGSPQERVLLDRASRSIATVVAANTQRSASTAINDNIPRIGAVAASPDERPDNAQQ